MKICHLIFSLEVGGAETLLIDIINKQIEKAPVTLILINNRVSTVLLKKLDAKVQVYCLNRKAGNKKSVIFLLRLWKVLIKVNPDVIHCHNNNLIVLLPFFKNKAVVTIHCLQAPTTYLKKYKKVFAISESVFIDIKERKGILSSIVSNGLNFKHIRVKQMYSQPHCLKLVQIGRLEHGIKGQDILLQALAILKSSSESLHFKVDFIGVGSSDTYLNKLVSELHLEDEVSFLGEIDRYWIFTNLYKYDILIQPSRSEGFGLTLLEGIAAGLPVIGANCGGPAEILSDMPSGFLFETGNASELANAIVKISKLYIQNNIKDLCEKAIYLAKSKYSIETTAEKYLHEYAL